MSGLVYRDWMALREEEPGGPEGAFLGHDDARRVVPESIAGWRDHLKHAKDLAARSMSQKYPAAVRKAADPPSCGRAMGGKVGQWVRDAVKITDKRLQPDHAWRHRFKTAARDTGKDREVRAAIQGQEDGRAAGDYGEVSLKTMWSATRICQGSSGQTGPSQDLCGRDRE